MNKKTVAQLLLGLFAFVIAVAIYLNFFNKKDVVDDLKKDPLQKENQIKGLRYFSKDTNDNTYLILAESGKPDPKKDDLNLIILDEVKAYLNFDEKGEIIVFSKNAVYNTVNNDTEFFNDVVLLYEDHKISCNKIIAKFSENYAKLLGNLTYDNISTRLFADQMHIDLISRTVKTSMYDKEKKVKIITNNGSN